MTLTPQITRAALALIQRLAPPPRRAWFAAMEAEFHAIPRAAQTGFLLGCLRAATTERALAMTHPTVRITTLVGLGATAMALLAAVQLMRVGNGDPAVGATFGIWSLYWGVTAVYAFRGKALAVLTAGAAGVALAAGGWLAVALGMRWTTANPEFLYALSLEAAALCGAVVAAAIFLRWKGQRSKV